MDSHPPYFDLTEHSSLSALQVLSTLLPPLHPSHLLPPPHISVIFLPVTLHSILSASCCSNSLSSCFQHHYVFFSTASCPSHPPPPPPTSLSLTLPKTLLSPLSLTHPPCYFPSSCTQNRSCHLPIWANDTCPCLLLCVWQHLLPFIAPSNNKDSALKQCELLQILSPNIQYP